MYGVRKKFRYKIFFRKMIGLFEFCREILH